MRNYCISLISCFLTLLVFAITPAFAVHDNDAMELEGNAVDDLSNNPEDDWDTVLLGGGGLSFETTGVIFDGEGPTIFTGGRKDIQHISSWSHKSGAVPDKGEITNAYAAAYNVAGDLVIYFGADRIATSGDAFIGFWLFQDEIVAEVSDGSFSGEHMVGDLLVLANFTRGGSVPEIQVLEWVEFGGDQKQGTLNLRFSDDSALCGNKTNDFVCAIVNNNPEDSPWPYTPKGGSLGDDFPPRAFFEGGVNISELFAASGGAPPCFASFMAETRSSTSVTASLKDFALDSFAVCGVEITKTCDAVRANANETGYIYTYSGTVTNTGFGTLYDVTVHDITADTSHDLGIINPNTPENYGPFDFESTTVVGDNRVEVTAATSAGGVPTVTDGPISATCPGLDRDPMIGVTKTCNVTVEDQGDLVALRIDIGGQVCNDTAPGPDGVTLELVTVTDDRGTASTADDQVVLGPITLTPGDCESYSDNYLPDSTNDTDPSQVNYTDNVTAVGFDKLTAEQVEETAADTCYICPPAN